MPRRPPSPIIEYYKSFLSILGALAALVAASPLLSKALPAEVYRFSVFEIDRTSACAGPSCLVDYDRVIAGRGAITCDKPGGGNRVNI